MHTPLHSIETLSALADGEGLSATWARGRLALQAPEHLRHFPWADGLYDPAVAAGPPELVDLLVRDLGRTRPCPEGLASGAWYLASYGLLPADPEPLGAALRGALARDGSAADLWLVHGLAGLGLATPDDLVIAARHEGELRLEVLPVVALRVAASMGQADDAADEVARSLRAVLDDHPGLLASVLVDLGAPAQRIQLPSDDPAEAARLGALAAGAELPVIRIRGSRRRRTQQWVQALLHDVPGPAAALLRAAFQADPPPAWGLSMVATAAWLALRRPEDPLEDVRYRFAGVDGPALSAARRSVHPGLAEDLGHQIRQVPDPALSILALPLVPDHPDLARDVVEAFAVQRILDLRSEAAAAAAAWHTDRLPHLLADPSAAGLALMLAEWVPSEEVLTALLELDPPQDEALAVQYATTLAAMGDAAALEPLSSVLASIPDELATLPRLLVRELLHQRV